jgi:hypothetical protein
MVMVSQPFVCTFLDHSMLTSFILEISPILNDKCQLQAYPLVIANPIDADEFSMYGLSLMEFARKRLRMKVFDHQSQWHDGHEKG